MLPKACKKHREYLKAIKKNQAPFDLCPQCQLAKVERRLAQAAIVVAFTEIVRVDPRTQVVIGKTVDPRTGAIVCQSVAGDGELKKALAFVGGVDTEHVIFVTAHGRGLLSFEYGSQGFDVVADCRGEGSLAEPMRRVAERAEELARAVDPSTSPWK